MPRKKSVEKQVEELEAQKDEAMMELAVARSMYQDMLNIGVSEQALAKGREVIQEWASEVSTLQSEISAIRKSPHG